VNELSLSEINTDVTDSPSTDPEKDKISGTRGFSIHLPAVPVLSARGPVYPDPVFFIHI
jgi:hypothetical protein